MNWQERINRAKDSGQFTQEDNYLASSFDTCAVGEQSGEFALIRLGLDFLDAVHADDAYHAQEVYDSIQAWRQSNQTESHP